MSAAASVVELHPEPSDSGSYDPKRAATPSTEQYAAFEVIFNHFNAELFEGRLSPVMLAFSKKQKSLGYYKHERWRRPGEERGRVGEIALTPEHLADDERDVASTVVHEMVHLWQFTYGKASRRGYHNAEWAAKMEALGLVPSNTGEPGGKRTGQGMTHYIVEGGPFTMAYEKLGRDVLLPFIAGSAVLKDKPEPKPADPSKTKFTCPVCGDSARGKVTLQIDCHKCAVPMVPETPLPRPVVAIASAAPADTTEAPEGAQVGPGTSPTGTTKEVPAANTATDKDTDFDWNQLPWQDAPAVDGGESATG
jgi:predicted SprT family Zn-dependent metalloprotease